MALLLCFSSRARAHELRAVAGRSFYTTEPRGELILFGADDLLDRPGLSANVLLGDTPLAQDVPLERGRQVTVPFDLAAVPEGDNEVICVLSADEGATQSAGCLVTKLPPRPNAVQIDRVSGGLIVDGLPFLPFGFYCYSPVQPTLAEEEIVKGFNLMSPYQRNDPRGANARRRYMDRCAELGMKVHYQVIRLATIGRGVDSQERDRREQLLRAEVKAFRDHPALLAWYISDEPDGNNIAPEALERSYRIVRELDPYHPITIVSMRPEGAKDYLAATDVVMTDPYPIPHNPPAAVYDAIAPLVSEVGPAKPVWVVPQAFGGNEWWRREPTAREERLMTYLGLIGGATGVQYFIRHGLNGFPKSTSAWGECGRLALEATELTPALLSREARPAVVSSVDSVHAAAWRDRGSIVVLAANAANRPQMVRLTMEGASFSGQADVLFENREIEVSAGAIEDMVDAYGTRAYRIPLGPFPDEDLEVDPRNQILDPSFEDTASPGTPASCYADVGAGRGATYFTDARVARHGRHSVRLVVPRAGQQVALRPYAPSVKEGRRYRFSVWAKAQEGSGRLRPGRRPGLLARLFGARRRPPRHEPPVLKLSMPGIGEQVFPLTTEWQEYVLEGTLEGRIRRSWLSFALITRGIAWVDLVQLVGVSPEPPPG
jgi:hypothetical protein